MFKSEFLKPTSGAALLAVAPTLALQAQGGVTSSTNAAVSVFEKLGNKIGLEGTSAKVFKYFAYTGIVAGSVFLLYCFVRLVENRAALNILNEKVREELASLEEKVPIFKEKFIKWKNKLEKLYKISELLKGKSSAFYWYKREFNEECESIKKYETNVEKYTNLMKKAGIYEKFKEENNLVEKANDFNDFNCIEDLDTLSAKLRDELWGEEAIVGVEFHLSENSYGRIRDSLGKKDEKTGEMVYPSLDDLEREIERRVAKEEAKGEKSSEVYKAYLRKKLVESLEQLLKAKKEKKRLEDNVRQYKNVDVNEGLKTVKSSVESLIQEIEPSVNDGNVEKMWAKWGHTRYVNRERSYLTFKQHLEDLKKVRDIDLGNINIENLPNLYPIKPVADDLEYAIEELELGNTLKILKNGMESKKSQKIEEWPFFRVPGKQIAEAKSFNFDD